MDFISLLNKYPLTFKKKAINSAKTEIEELIFYTFLLAINIK
jgi:hypothetical protein